jgi:hypothetical protein
MRIDANDIVCGLPAPTIRDVMRLFRSPKPQSLLKQWVNSDDAGELAHALHREGWIQLHHVGGDGETWWETTIRGNALAQASFRRPISRRTAERHLRSVIQRAEEYNPDDKHFFDIIEIVVFGSYLDPGVSHVGDLDLAIVTRDRVGTDDPADDLAKRALAYADASGRQFNSFYDRLAWAEREVIRYLRNRASAISITGDDVRTFTNRWKVVYTFEQ